jgi:aspartate/glutamate racemase
MSAKRLTLIHTSAMMIPVFGELCTELLPKVEVVHLVDESLLKDIIRDKCLLKPTARRVVGHIISAEQAGADFIMVTCSSIGSAAELGRQLVDVPVMRVDEPMAELAVKEGAHIGVIATLPSTLNPTADLIRAQARKEGKEVTVTTKLCEGAFEAVISGDGPTHDRIVGAGIRELMQQVEVIVLAQASMARVVDNLPAESKKIPILSSPRLAVEHIRQAGFGRHG